MGKCMLFMDKHKAEMHSMHGNKIGEASRENFCVKFNAEVGENCVCRHRVVTDGVVGEEDE